MTTRPHRSPLALTAAAALALTLAACGGGNGEAPPQGGGSVVVPAAPVVTITNNVAAEVASGDVLFTFSFNTDVGTSFTADDITVTGGTKGAFTRIGGTSATLVVTPTPQSTGMLEVAVAANAVADATGLGNAAVSAMKAFSTVLRTVMVSFDEVTAPVLTGFGGAEDATVVPDPTNAANKVARVVKSATAEVWAGTTVSVCPNQAIARLPFSASLRQMSVRVWSPAAGVPVRLKVEDAADGTRSVETEATTSVAAGWQTLVFDFGTPATGTAALNLAYTYDKASIFFNFGTAGSATGARTYYFDDVAFVGSSFTPACAAPPGGTGTVLANFDDVNPPTAGFEGAEGSAVEAGPPGGGAGRSFKVLRSGGQVFALGIIETPVPVTATRRTISAQVFSPLAGIPMVMKIEGPGGANSGDVTANEAVVAGWQTLTWTFSGVNPALTFNKIVLLPRLGTVDAPPGQAYWFDTLTLLPDAAPPPPAATVLANFDDLNPPTFGFEGAEGSAVEAGPGGGGSGRSFKVLRSGGQVFALGIIETTVPVTATRRTITAQVYSPLAGIPMVMKIEGPGGANSGDVSANEPVVVGWQTLSWTFSGVDPALTFNKIVLLPRLGTVDAPPGQAYWFDDISLAAAPGGSGSAGPLVFASGYRQGGTTAQGGSWGYFSGDFANYSGNTFTGGGFADSTPPVADDAQFFFIALTTTAPTSQTGSPPTSGGFIGMFVTHPGLALTGQTTLAVNLGMDANFFQQATNKNIDVFVVGSTNYSNGAGGDCKVTLKGSITPTTDAMITYTVPLSTMALVQPCNGGGFTSGVTTVAQALAQPIGAVNTQFTFPNVNTTVNSGTPGAPVYATGITRGKTEFR